MLRQTPRRALYAVIAGLGLFFFFLSGLVTTSSSTAAGSGSRSKSHRPAVTPPIAKAAHRTQRPHIPPRLEVELIVATTSRDNITWLDDKLKGWTKNVYVVDDPSAALTVPKNKGHEAMVYLTYIIDRYDSLPPNMVFHHAQRFQWHNDDPDYDALPPLKNLQLDYVQEVGYTNLRCSWAMGCPVEIRPKMPKQKYIDGEVPTAQEYPKAFRALLPGSILPDEVGANCCAQFAVSRKVVRERKKEEYERMRDWLIETDLTDDMTGRIFEYTWHIIFGRPSKHCPNAAVCYCKLYGHCQIPCSERGCKGRYEVPGLTTMPKGWPYLGWKGEPREWEEPIFASDKRHFAY